MVRGDAHDCLVPPTACAVMELLEDIGENFYHNYYINFSLINFLIFSPDRDKYDLTLLSFLVCVVFPASIYLSPASEEPQWDQNVILAEMGLSPTDFGD